MTPAGTPPRLQPLTRAKVDSLGAIGAEWLAALPATLAALEGAWSIRLGRPLPGGSASYVVRATDADGVEVVVKVALPDQPLDAEARLLAAADGRGYARLLAHDTTRAALLLEALGPSLEAARLEPEAKLALLGETLREAWAVPLTAVPAAAPGARAAYLHGFVARLAREQGRTDQPAVRRALAYAEHLATDPRPDTEVVAHGDCHPANLLRSTRPGPGPAYLFVDPDGFRAEPEHDAGVAVRDWVGQLDVADPRAVLEGYCSLLADTLGLDAGRVWEWGYLERVSTGLYVVGFGAERLGGRFLDSAERLLG